MRSDGRSSQGRLLWIDALRALAMLLVIIGHLCSGRTPYFVFTSPVKLPLFFAVSGYVFNGHRKQARDFYSGLLRRLLIPWLIVSLADALLFLPRNGLSYLPGALRDIAVGETLWYIPCALFAEIIHRRIRRLCPSTAAVCAASAACLALGLILSRSGVLDTLMINRALVAQAFLLIGYLFRTREHRLDRVPFSAMILMGLMYIAMGAVSMRLWPGKAIDVHTNRYYCLPYNLAMIGLGCATLFLAARSLRRIPAFLTFIGQNTLIYYFFHIYFVSLLRSVFSKLLPSLPYFAAVAIAAVLTCVGCGALARLVNRYCPILAGRRRPGRAT